MGCLLDHDHDVDQHTDRELLLEMYKVMLVNQREHEASRNKVEQAILLARIAFLAVFGATIGRLFGFDLPDLTA